MRFNHTPFFVFFVAALVGCTPFSDTNPPTGNVTGPVVGGAAGYGLGSLLHLTRTGSAALGIGGAGLGYYLTTQRFSSAEIVSNGGQVFSLGQFVTINLPTDTLFEPNSADFLPGKEPVLESAVSVLNRYPDDNVVVSGNMSGFASSKTERKLSEARARQVAAFLWSRGFNNFNHNSNTMDRKLMYVGYGNYFPVANHFKMEGIRANSRIQITASPSNANLDLGRCHVFNNIGDLREPKSNHDDPSGLRGTFSSDNHMPDDTDFARTKPFTDSPLANSENIAAAPSVIYDADHDAASSAFETPDTHQSLSEQPIDK
jgi:outer membrane protein OmpA-like peptidoglycan-associated protein